MDDRTKLIKEKLSNLKSNKSVDDSTASSQKTSAIDDFKLLIVFLIRISSVCGSLYYICIKFNVLPFSMWQSIVIYFGITSLITLFRSK